MPDVSAYLREIVHSVEPTARQHEAAAASHRNLRALLFEGNIGKRILDSYLGGSYARDTAVRPIDDVDIIFLIDPRGWSVGWGGVPSPDAVLTTFANAIRYRYPVSSVYWQRRSVRLELSHLDIDVVPAIPASDSGVVIKVPDTESDSWILSAPKLHEQNATEVNVLRARLFKPLVKLLKFWNGNLPDPARLKSFTIETMAVRIFSQIPFSDLNDGLMKFLDFCCHIVGNAQKYNWNTTFGMSFGVFGNSVPDAAGTASNTASYVDATRRDKFASRALVSLERMDSANQARFTESARSYVDGALRA